MILYHGTSLHNALQIEEHGFVPDKSYNWEVRSRKGLVYLSLAYAPFYAMNAKPNSDKGALIKVDVPKILLLAEDDFIMYALKKPVYTNADLKKVDKLIFHVPQNVEASLKYMGNCAAEPQDIKILGVRYFGMSNLIMACDPAISPMNYMFMGEYYRRLSDWIYEGKDALEFAHEYNRTINEQLEKVSRKGGKK